jgi:hypothetical protein
MNDQPKLDPARRRRLRYAEGKLVEARQRQARAERGILYWSRVVADLHHERTLAIQHPLWPEEEPQEEN